MILKLLSLGSLLLLQLVVGGYALWFLASDANLPFAWNVDVAIGIVSIVVVIYVLLGGFNAILETDKIQIAFLFGVFGLLVFHLVAMQPPAPDWFERSIQQTTMPDFWTSVTLIVGGICWVLGGGDIWQRIIAARDQTVARRAMVATIGALILFGSILAVFSTVGIQSLTSQELASDNFRFVHILDHLPEVVRAFAAVGLVAALMSTADTELFIIAEILHKESIRERTEQDHSLTMDPTRTRWIVFAVAFVTTLLAFLLKEQLVTVYYVLLNVFVIAGSLMLATLYNRGSGVTFLVGALGGIGVLIVLAVFDSLHDGWPLLVLVPTIPAFIQASPRLYLSTTAGNVAIQAESTADGENAP